MRNPAKRLRPALTVETLERRDLLSAAPGQVTLLAQEPFDKTAAGALPSGWSQWSSQAAFTVSSGTGASGSSGLVSSGDSGQAARAWVTSKPADVRASADVFVNSLVPSQVFVRGSNLDTTRPTYYSVSVTRGLDVRLLRSVNGTVTTLGHLRSSSYLSNQWVTVSLRAAGTDLQVLIQRRDTGQYLNSRGRWQAGSTAALHVTDSAVRGGGATGLGRAAGYSGAVSVDSFAVRAATASTSAAPLFQENFNKTPNGQLPAGWYEWESEGSLGASAAKALSPRNGLAATTGGGDTARAWMNASAPADAQVSAAVFLNSLAPAEVLLRGSGLNTASPSYYAVSVTRGLEVQLLRVSRGRTTTLATLDSNSYVSNQWVQVTLRASGSSLQAIVQRLDTKQYLAGDGHWQASPATALTVTDTAVTGAGQAGVGKAGDYGGTVTFDNFSVARPGAAPFSVSITSPGSHAVLRNPTAVRVNVSNAAHVAGVDFYVDNVLQASDATAPYTWTLDPGTLSEGAHSLTAVARDQGGATARTSLTVNTVNTVNIGGGGGVGIPQHHPWIRLAELAYSGTPLGSFERNLLQTSVDLVIPNTDLLPNLNSISPKTPNLIYTNVSSLYRELQTDWLNWADAHHVNRESAFYHVATPTKFSGKSSASQPVNWFWGVYLGGGSADFTDVTSAAHDPSSRAVQFGDVGTSVYIAYPDKFREINFRLSSGARSGWSGVLDYATAVDARGVPTAWAPLKTISDTTNGLTRSGRVTFDPPSDWTTASVNGSARMFYVRVRTTGSGSAPVADTILGRDYTNSTGGGWAGTIPTFDYSADRNHDGYLSDAEFAHHHAGMNARFVYETRLFPVAYGPQRPATNPSSAAFKAWAADYDVRLLKSQPLADGLFVDNSSGKPPADPGAVLEPVATYAQDYGSVLNAIGHAIAPRWVLANTSGGQTVADGVVGQNTAYFEESALRPLASNWQQFEDLADLISHRASLESPPPYAVLDSLATGGSPTDPRTQIATLAMYYMMADPKTTFLDFYGGQEPATSWSRHYSRAANYDVGQPIAGWSLFASGQDPSDRRLSYNVYQRHYTNALVLYKPLSHSQGVRTDGKLGSNTATVHRLNGTYRPLRTDGTLGSPITSLTLRNGEGAILVPVTGGD
jgi:hypothetical protein